MLGEYAGRSPLCLIVPGVNGAGPGHWQAIWREQRRDCEEVDLGTLAHPHRNSWIGRLDRALHVARGPVILVAHSLGCHAVAAWAGLLGEAPPAPVIGALLVAPPDVDRRDADPRLAPFAPSLRKPLPFPSILVASRDDPYATIDRSHEMASNWCSRIVDIGEAGHIDAAAGLGAWRDGERLLEQLADECGTDVARPALPPAHQSGIRGLAGRQALAAAISVDASANSRMI